MAQSRITGPAVEDIMKDVRNGVIAPIYLLEGEEPFFIDRLSSFLFDTLAPEGQRDFDAEIFYGLESDAKRIADSCRQFPVMSERRVVLVREAQQMRGNQDALEAYANNPSPTTVLILCYKGGVMDARKSASKAIAKAGVIYESKRIYETSMPGFVTRTAKEKGADIETKAVEMLVEFVGLDLARMDSEISKLCNALPQGGRRITAVMVEEQTGLSREYNNYELVSALARRNKAQALKIVKYFNSNPRSFAISPTLSILYGFYSDLMLTFYSPDKTEKGVAGWLGQPDWKVRKDIVPGMKSYPAKKVLRILHEIRQTDGKSKGVEGCRMAPGDLLLELVLFILQ